MIGGKAYPMSDYEVPAAVASDMAIWRYMDLARFVSMLATKTLWFSKAAQFHDDPYEGYCRVTPAAMPADEYGPEPLTLEKTGGKPVPVSFHRFVAEVSHMSAEYFEKAREHLYVNSWCRADESMAMWEIYGSSGRGVAVRSSVGRYRRAMKLPFGESQFAFGTVEYHADMTDIPDLDIDLRAGSIPMPGQGVWERILKLAFHKRSCFEYEREWRGALYQDARLEPGCNVEFELDELVGGVYVGPRADGFFYDMVASVMDRFGLVKPLECSTLLQPPRRHRSAVAGE